MKVTLDIDLISEDLYHAIMLEIVKHHGEGLYGDWNISANKELDESELCNCGAISDDGQGYCDNCNKPLCEERLRTGNEIMSDFIHYCEEDNMKLSNDIKTWLADYFDLPHRVEELTSEEYDWIEENISPEHKREIFGYQYIDKDAYNEKFKEEKQFEELDIWIYPEQLNMDRVVNVFRVEGEIQVNVYVLPDNWKDIVTDCHGNDGKPSIHDIMKEI